MYTDIFAILVIIAAGLTLCLLLLVQFEPYKTRWQTLRDAVIWAWLRRLL